MRRNKTPFYPLNYTGMIPGQDGPDRGLLQNFVGYPIFKGPEDHPHRPPNASLSVAQRVVY
jgi:hypothetical protein